MFIDNLTGNIRSLNNTVYLDYIENESNYVLETTEAGGEYIDIASGNLTGQVIYPHGLIIFLGNTIFYQNNLKLDWTSVHPLFTTSFNCEIKDYEYNFTLNPTAVDISGNLKNNLDNDEFTPYITTVGLYNEENELLAVAKLSKPIKKPKSTDMVIKIKIDF